MSSSSQLPSLFFFLFIINHNFRLLAGCIVFFLFLRFHCFYGVSHMKWVFGRSEVLWLQFSAIYGQCIRFFFSSHFYCQSPSTCEWMITVPVCQSRSSSSSSFIFLLLNTAFFSQGTTTRLYDYALTHCTQSIFDNVKSIAFRRWALWLMELP